VAERPDVDASLDAVLREERARLTGALVRIIGDWEIAEELVQDAALAALEHWPAEGVPRNPGAWLMTTARRRAVDRLRRQATMTFRALTGDSPDMVTTVARFLALLELFREGAVAFEQLTPLGELTIRWTGTASGELDISDEFDESSSP